MYTTHFYCPFCTNNSNTFVLCTFNCRLCSRFYNTDDWNVYFFLYCIKGKSTCRVTRNHNCLYVLCFQKSNNLSGVTYNRILRLATVWNSSRIAKICNALFRKLSYYLTVPLLIHQHLNQILQLLHFYHSYLYTYLFIRFILPFI